MRRIQNIRSSAGKMARAAVPKESKDYQLFMQITCLEMEKVRKGVERTAALNRVHGIDARLSEIEVEENSLLQRLAQRAGAAPSPSDVSPAFAGITPAGIASTGSFHIRY